MYIIVYGQARNAARWKPRPSPRGPAAAAHAATRSRVMSRIRSKDSIPELIVRRLVHRMGFRYKLHVQDLPSCPDLVFPARRKVVLVNGCFWLSAQAMPTGPSSAIQRELLASKAGEKSGPGSHQRAASEGTWVESARSVGVPNEGSRRSSESIGDVLGLIWNPVSGGPVVPFGESESSEDAALRSW